MKPDPAKKMNEQEADRIAYLLSGFMRQTLTETEHDELDEWITARPENQRLFEELTDPYTLEVKMDELSEPMDEIALERTKKRLQFSNQLYKGKKASRRIWYSTAAAAVLLLAGVYFIYTLMNRNTTTTIEPDTTKSALKPGGNQAILILANGDTVNLANAKNGLIDSSSGSDVMKTAEGQLSYENPEGRIVAYHTLNTPIGGQYSVTLPDGSRVWLNSSSSLRYPVAFTGKERAVELQGEAYFEVKHIDNNTPLPFIVKTGDAEVQVLGTRFNVNAYKDEKAMKTTLLEGAVMVRSSPSLAGGQESVTLKPGEQAILVDGRVVQEVSTNVDAEEVLAWKNGMFRFRDEPIENIMRQVGRWYGAEIVYVEKIDFHFNATIYRNEPVERLLEILEETKRVKFKIEGKKIYVRG